MFKVPEKYRVKTGPTGSDASYGNNGHFIVRGVRQRRPLFVQASDGEGWEHVSVSLPDRCPTWDEMQRMKALFWDAEDFVVQIHPPKSHYVNMHPYCLHMWRKCGTNRYCDAPPFYLVGIR